MSSQSNDKPDSSKEGVTRRNFFTTGVMALGLAASYGTLGAIAGRFLYPARPSPRLWLYVAKADNIKMGESIKYRTPSGQGLTIARRGKEGKVEDFIALSSTCPHLGCQVHWEQQNNRFFCPCHNGVFNPGGKAIAGPPAEAGQSLLRYPLKIKKGLLYIEVPVETAQAGKKEIEVAMPRTPGHDPCLNKDYS